MFRGRATAPSEAVKQSVGRRKRLPHKNANLCAQAWDRRFRLSTRRSQRLLQLLGSDFRRLLYAGKDVSAIPLGGRISHFDILEKLGEGGMGAVYKARDHRLDRLVAIKVLSGNAAATPERQARFIQEAKTAPAREDSRLPAQR